LFHAQYLMVKDPPGRYSQISPKFQHCAKVLEDNKVHLHHIFFDKLMVFSRYLSIVYKARAYLEKGKADHNEAITNHAKYSSAFAYLQKASSVLVQANDNIVSFPYLTLQKEEKYQDTATDIVQFQIKVLNNESKKKVDDGIDIAEIRDEDSPIISKESSRFKLKNVLKNNDAIVKFIVEFERAFLQQSIHHFVKEIDQQLHEFETKRKEKTLMRNELYKETSYQEVRTVAGGLFTSQNRNVDPVSSYVDEKTKKSHTQRD